MKNKKIKRKAQESVPGLGYDCPIDRIQYGIRGTRYRRLKVRRRKEVKNGLPKV